MLSLLLLWAGLLPVQSALVLNEVMANNRGAVRNGGGYPDWVELYNPGPGIADLAGMSLSDNLSQPKKFIFPAGTFLGPGQYLIVWCDNKVSPGELHAPFSLSNTGEEVGLFSSTETKIDSMKFGIQAEDYSVGRIPNSTGDWTLTKPTPAAANATQPLGSVETLVINEWMASPVTGEDWLELYSPDLLPVAISGCVFSDKTSTPSTNRPIRALSFMGPESYIQFFPSSLAKADADHLDFKLGSKGETISLFAPDLRTLLHHTKFDAQTSGVSQGRLPDGSATLAYFPVGKATPSASNFLPISSVVLNEILTHSDFPFEDAVELRNTTADVVDISYWWMSNSKTDPKKYAFPAGTRIPAFGYHVVYQRDFDPNGTGSGRSFRFNSARGDDCLLFTADATGVFTGGRASVKLPPAENAVSFGRFETSIGVEFVPQSVRTFGSDTPGTIDEFRTGTGRPNGYPKVGPLVISEIMYHPRGALPTDDNTLDEYIELRNITGASVLLYNPFTDPSNSSNRWRLGGLVEFGLPLRAVCPPNGFILLVGFDPIADPDTLSSFKTRYSVPESALIFGPLSGKLSNGGGSLEVYKPDEIQRPPRPDTGLIPVLLVERVQYDDVLPWPAEADGQGASLHRVRLTEFGNDPVNWTSSPPTPGRRPPPPLPPQFSSIELEDDFVTLKFEVQRGVAYQLEYTETAPNPSTVWIPLLTFAEGAEARMETVSEPLPPNPTQRYYRLVAADE